MGVILLLMLLFHIITSVFLFKQRPLSTYILGIAAICCLLVTASGFCLRHKWKANWIKVHRMMTLLALFIILIHIGSCLLSVKTYQNEIKKIKMEEVQIGNIKDGTYLGECDVEYIYAKVEVTVKDGKIEAIRLLEHRNERGGPAEAILDSIIKQQSVPVDAVSGATNSSKVIEKAVENALQSVEKK